MKQTAKNNEYLQAVKQVVNEKIYKRVLAIYNESGIDETIKYLNQFFNWAEIEKIYVSPNLWYYKK